MYGIYSDITIKFQVFPKISIRKIILISHLEKYLIEYFSAAAQNTHDKMKEKIQKVQNNGVGSARFTERHQSLNQLVKCLQCGLVDSSVSWSTPV